jgi:hypothetical protein
VRTKTRTKTIPYPFTCGGYFYFSRRVPSDLLHHYTGTRTVQGLRAKSHQTAKTRALVAAAKLVERWSPLRFAHGEAFSGKLQKSGDAAPEKTHGRLSQAYVPEPHGSTLVKAPALYQTQKRKDRGKNWRMKSPPRFDMVQQYCRAELGRQCLHPDLFRPEKTVTSTILSHFAILCLAKLTFACLWNKEYF